MYCNIRVINLKNNYSVDISSLVGDNGILCTKFKDSQPQGDFKKTRGIRQLGVKVNSSTLTERDILIEGNIIGEDRRQVEILKNQLVFVFNPLDPLLLKYNEDYIEKEIEVRAASVPLFSNELNTHNLLGFIVNLDAPNPLWRDQEDTFININTWESAFEFDFELINEGIEFARKGPNEIEVINNGQEDAPFEIFFKAPALNPKVVLNSKEYIKVNKKLEDGEILYISTEYGNTKVEIQRADGTKENAYGYIDIYSNFFKLPIGISNLSYSTEGDFIPQSVIVKYKNQYRSL